MLSILAHDIISYSQARENKVFVFTASVWLMLLFSVSVFKCINIISVTDLPKTGLLHITLFLFAVLIYFILKVKAKCSVSFRLAKGVFQIFISWCLGLLPTLTPFPFPVC